MRNPALEPLLILQERDTRRVGLETQLRVLPQEVGLVEKKIAAEKAAIDAARSEVKELEVKKKGIETEIGSTEEKQARYKTQQLSVRKNDEYQALGHEIELTQKQIGDLEGAELETMYRIDEAKKRFAAAEALLKENISGYEARIRMLREREGNTQAELAAVRIEVQAARAPVSLLLLDAYDQVLPRGLPAVVPIRGGKCGGCHLKVSSEVESAARGRAVEGEVAACDQCSRLVYWE